MSTFNIDDSGNVLVPTGFDAKLCNTYIEGANIVIETIAEYLIRIPEPIRSPGIPVTMLLPKEGQSAGTFPIQTYKDIIVNYDIKYYTFVDGVGDDDFQEISFGDNYEYWSLQKDVVKYGLLYNWYAATDARNICAEGWEVPSLNDFDTLITYLGGSVAADLYLKSIGFVPYYGGYRESTIFEHIDFVNCFGVTDYDPDDWRVPTLRTNENEILNSTGYAVSGFSIRLIKTTTDKTHGQTGTYTGNDGKVYRTICIGTQEWLADNLAETKFRTGEAIPEVTDNAAWAALETAGMCAYDNDWDNVMMAGTININSHDLVKIVGNGIDVDITEDGTTKTINLTVPPVPEVNLQHNCYIAWRTSEGVGFTLIPNVELPYEAILITHDVLDPPVESDFDGLWRNRFLQHYCYIAWKNETDGFTLIPNIDKKYEAILVTHKYIATPVESDFSGLWRERVNTFLKLADVIDDTYTAKAWNVPKVNDAQEALELVATEELITILAKTTLLADMPSSLTGKAGYSIRVNLDESGYEFYLPS